MLRKDIPCAFPPLWDLAGFTCSNIGAALECASPAAQGLFQPSAMPPVFQIKCDQYWPGRGTDTYGMIQVTLLDTIELATFCVRTFSLHKVSFLPLLFFPRRWAMAHSPYTAQTGYGGVTVPPLTLGALLSLQNGSSEKREVRQFQFTAWPDHGVPEYPTPFLAFLRRVKTCNPPDAGPIVVHCRYGFPSPNSSEGGRRSVGW